MLDLKYVFRDTLLTLVLCLIVYSSSWGQTYQYSKIKVQTNSAEEIYLLHDLDLGLDHAHRDSHGGITFFIRKIDLSLLETNNFSYEVLIPDFEEYYRVQQEKDQSKIAKVKKNANIASSFGYGSMGGFYTLAEIESKLDEMHTLYPQLVKEKYSIGTSVEGRTIWAIKISDNPDVDEPEPSVYYDALTHAREPLSMASTINYMFWILENYATNPKVKHIIDERELYFVPVVNPDGYEYNRSTNPNGGGFWRKNRRSQPTCIGVDLNRNFDYQFGADPFCSSTSRCSDTYRGPSAFSEPETQAVRDFVAQIEPAASFTTHSWDGSYLLPDEDGVLDIQYDRYSEWATDFTNDNGYIFGNALDLLGYTACGTTDAYLRSEGVFCWTPEIGVTGFWPAQSDIFGFVGDQVQPFLYQASISGAYTDVKSTKQLTDALVGGSFSLLVELLNKGISQTATNTAVEIEAITAGISVSASQSYGSINAEAAKDNSNNPFSIAISSGFAGSSFDLDIIAKQGGAEMTRERITIFIGARQILFEDDAENGLSNWSSSGQGGNWELCTEDKYSGSNCFCDSNGGASSSNDDKFFTLNQGVDLTMTIEPRLQFFTKWSLEDSFDEVYLEINDGSGWTNLKTYEANSAWTFEQFDLSSFQSSSNFQIRFNLDNDSGKNGDGFYFDDLQIVDYDSNASGPCVALPQNLEVDVDPNMNETYQAVDSLFSDAKVTSGLDVTFKAGRVIGLGKDFEVENGATFLATIEDCSANSTENSIQDRTKSIPEEHAVNIYPNPFSAQTTIQYELSKKSEVQIHILDISGRIIETLSPLTTQQEGLHQVEWTANHQSTGLYLLRLQIDSQLYMKKLVRTK